MVKGALRSLQSEACVNHIRDVTLFPQLTFLMYYVYLLRSVDYSEQTYIGFSKDLKARFKAHSNGQSKHTAKYRPWRLVTYLGFESESKARDFEQYLKSHSGMAFASKRLW